MGATLCCPGDSESGSTAQPNAAAKQANKNQGKKQQQPENEEHLLLLGAGGCGKSTVVKQMRLIYAEGFSAADKEFYRSIIRDNAITSISSILSAMQNLNIEFKNDELDEKSSLIRDFQESFDAKENPISPEIVEAVITVWLDEGLQECFLRSNEYQLQDTAQYFIEKIQDIAKPDYIPSNDDIIRSRIQTREHQEVTINVRTNEHACVMRITDVGGQRNQRRKWNSEFQKVTAIIFVAALSDYDSKLNEPESSYTGKRGTNRMEESLNLFGATINESIFKQKNIVLFLNKTDLFRNKVVRSPINKYFSDYSDGPDYRKGVEYFSKQFVSKNVTPDRQIFVHPTCATDTQAMENLINDVTDIIIRENLRAVGV